MIIVMENLIADLSALRNELKGQTIWLNQLTLWTILAVNPIRKTQPAFAGCFFAKLGKTHRPGVQVSTCELADYTCFTPVGS